MSEDWLKEITGQIAETAGYLWEKGWAERNAGNISVNVSSVIPDDFYLTFSEPLKVTIKNAFPSLPGKSILITSTGSRMRDLAKKPLDNLCLLRFGQDDSCYYVYSFNKKVKRQPTSEWPTHFIIQNHLCFNNSADTTVLHTHLTEIIALTHIEKYTNEKKINNLLFSMHPEISMFLPDGIGLIPFYKPGSNLIATQTVDAISKHRAIVWEKHGCLAIAQNPIEAFDILDIISKAIKIFLLSRNMA